MQPYRRPGLIGTAAAAALAFQVSGGCPSAIAHSHEARATSHAQHGKASYYHPRFRGRRMANGDPFVPEAHTAAHPTLPFGTVVRVVNLDTGRSATVRITDRGPHGRGRIIDVAPVVADQLGMRRAGIARVVVTPVDRLTEVAEAAPD